MNLKISEMKKTLKLSEDTLFPVVQGGENMAITANDLLNNIDWLLKHNKCHNTCEADVEQYKYDALLCQIKTAVVNSKEAKADSMNALTIAESSSKVADNAYDAAISARKEVLDIMAKNKQVDKVVVDVTAVKAQSELTATELQKEIADRKAADEEIKTQIANISINGNAQELQSKLDGLKNDIETSLQALHDGILNIVDSEYVKKTDTPATQDLSNYALKTELNNKQDTLVAGQNITITGNTISATQPDLSEYAKKAEIVQADWNETSATSNAFIKNKPTIPTIPTNVVVGTSQAYKIETVTALPTTPDANTIYLITE